MLGPAVVSFNTLPNRTMEFMRVIGKQGKSDVEGSEDQGLW